jgi:hypothetical protein
MEPFMAVWDGYSLGGTAVTGDALQPFIAEAIDQVVFTCSVHGRKTYVFDRSISSLATLRRANQVSLSMANCGRDFIFSMYQLPYVPPSAIPSHSL